MLSALGVAAKGKILSTCSPFNMRNLLPTNGLIVQRVSVGGSKYVAPLGDSPQGGVLVNVDEWLNG